MANREMYLERAANTSFEDRLGVLETKARKELESGALRLELPGAMELAGLDDGESVEFNPTTEDQFLAKLAERQALAA